MTQQYFPSLTALHCHACSSRSAKGGHVTTSAVGYLCKSFRLGGAITSLQFVH